MTTLTFHGATGTVTGSRHLLNLDGHRVLVDCGLFQGRKENRRRNWDAFPVMPSEIDEVILTHAHLDHSGYLPRLWQQGFRGTVTCTTATHQLCEILLMDSAHIQEEDARWANKRGTTRHKPALPLYTTADAASVLQQFKSVSYGDETRLDPDTRVKFRDAGHILGSSLVDIRRDRNGKSRKILFSGDLGRPSRPVLRDPAQVYNVDYLVLESTYGDRLHGHESGGDELARIVNESVERGGVLLIPAFSVGRTQTLLFTLRELEGEGKIPKLPIFVDSPMGIDATEVFGRHISDLNLECRRLALEDVPLFKPSGLTICRSRDESKRINDHKGPAIIISSSGMATGGRILHHLIHRLPHEKNTVLFVGYQAHGTRGHHILSGGDTVKIHGHYVPVRAQVESMSGYSGHADYEEILAWLMGFNQPPESVFLVHGDPEASEALADRIRDVYGWHVEVPTLGQTVELDF